MKPRRAAAPEGLRPAPRHAPKRIESTGDLRRLQRLMTHAIVRPLAEGDATPKGWGDGRTTEEVAAEFIRPNARLTAFERLQIYHRVYWFRVLGAAGEDCPGLRALLGEERFERLARAYLARHPSRSFTLRNLCSRLEGFIREQPGLTRPRTAAALAVARFEWAQTVAFDGPSRPVLSPEAVLREGAERLRVGLQPYVTLVESAFAVDDFVLAVKRRDALRGEASNTSERRRGARRAPPRPRLARRRSYIAVHRYQNRLYYKKLDRPQFRILCALRDGAPVAKALAAGGRGFTPQQVQEWFSTWMKLGWLCRPAPKRLSLAATKRNRR